MKYVSINERQEILNFNIEEELTLALKYSNNELHPVFSEFMNFFFNDFPLKGLNLNYQHFVDNMVISPIKGFSKSGDYESAFLCLCDFVFNTHFYLKGKQRYDIGLYDNKTGSDLEQFIKRISRVMHDLGYEVARSNKNKSVFVIKEINVLSDIVLETTKDPLIKRNVIEFLRYGISVKEKQTILEEMYKHFEGLSVVGGQAIETLKNLFNSGLRHIADNKVKNPEVYKYVKANYDSHEFMNNNFNLFLECYLHSVNSDYIKSIESLSKAKKEIVVTNKKAE